MDVFKSIALSHTGLLKSINSNEEGSVVHRLLAIFHTFQDEQAVKQTQEFKDTVQHSLLDAFLEGIFLKT